MSEQQKTDLKQLVGDSQAKVTASKEMSHSDYGSGGRVFVSVTLTCDQSQEVIDTAAQWAQYIATKNAMEQWHQLQQQLKELGITE